MWRGGDGFYEVLDQVIAKFWECGSHDGNLEARKPPMMAEMGLSFLSVGSASTPKFSKAAARLEWFYHWRF
jgi:hypothetical protein